MPEDTEYSGGAVGLTVFASVILMIGGTFQFLAGLAAIVNDASFVVTQDYILKLDTTAWGWVHLLIGVVLFLAGLSLLRGAVWARTVAVVVASISAVANFVWLPVQPWWAIIMITLAVFVIWAVTAHGRDITKV